MDYTVFDANTGRVLKSGSCSARFVHLQSDPADSAQIVIEGEYPDHLYYLEGGTPAPRPEIVADTAYAITADGSDAVTVEGIPPGTLVRFADRSVMIEDGVFEFVSPVARVLTIEIAPPFPWKARTITVVAT